MKTLANRIADAYLLFYHLVNQARQHQTQTWVYSGLAIGTLGVLYFHQRLADQLPPNDSIDVWATALDITLAHIVVTGFVLFLSMQLTKIAFKIFMEALKRVYRILPTSQSGDISKFWGSLLYAIYLLGYFAAALLFVYIPFELLIVRPGLQTLLFGSYDPGLGFRFPTTFRLTFLIDFMSLNLGNNSTLSKLFGFIGMAATFILGIVGVMKAVGYLSGNRNSN